jgi:hypothetical protein
MIPTKEPWIPRSTAESEYRLIQDGITVAEVCGPENDAFQEIMHYAAIYSQDGLVQIERKVEGEWRPMEPEGS